MDFLGILALAGVVVLSYWLKAKIYAWWMADEPKPLGDVQHVRAVTDAMGGRLQLAPWEMTLDDTHAGASGHVYSGTVKGRDCRCDQTVCFPKQIRLTPLGPLVQSHSDSSMNSLVFVSFTAAMEPTLWEGIICRSERWAKAHGLPFSYKKGWRDMLSEVFLDDASFEQEVYISGDEAHTIAWLDNDTRDRLMLWSERGFGWIIEGGQAICWAHGKAEDISTRELLAFFVELLELLDHWEERCKEASIVELLIRQVREEPSEHYQALAFDALTTHFPEDAQVKVLIQELLHDDEQELRWLAAEATGPDAIPLICDWIALEELTEEQRSACLSLLQQLDKNGEWRQHLPEWTDLYDQEIAEEAFVLQVMRLISYRDVDKLVQIGRQWLNASRDTSHLLVALLDVYDRIDSEVIAETMPVVIDCLMFKGTPVLQEKALTLLSRYGDRDDFAKLCDLRSSLALKEHQIELALERMSSRLGISLGAARGGLSVMEASEGSAGMLAISEEDGQLSLSEEESPSSKKSGL